MSMALERVNVLFGIYEPCFVRAVSLIDLNIFIKLRKICTFWEKEKKRKYALAWCIDA